MTPAALDPVASVGRGPTFTVLLPASRSPLAPSETGTEAIVMAGPPWTTVFEPTTKKDAAC